MRLPQIRLPSFHLRNPFRPRAAAPATGPAIADTPAAAASARPESAASRRSSPPDDALLFEPRPDAVTAIPGGFETLPPPVPDSGSAPPSYRSRSAPGSAAPSYPGTPLRDGEVRLHHDGQPMYERYAISGGRLGTPYPRQIQAARQEPDSGDISPLALSPVQSRPESPVAGGTGGRPRSPSQGSVGSMTSSQLEARLEALPPLSRLPTPP